MLSQAIQEFRGLPLKETLAAAKGSTIAWNSPFLNTMYPIEGRPPGSDRAVCHTVNGWLQVQLRDKGIIGDPTIQVTAGLWGEYAGIGGVIASTTYQLSDVTAVGFYQSNGGLAFDRWASFANLSQNTYIRLTFTRLLIAANPDTIDVVCSGALLGSDMRP